MPNTMPPITDPTIAPMSTERAGKSCLGEDGTSVESLIMVGYL
jgi:hypothetical protein